ncbi:extracellular tyrosine-protein kinase PKDCC-like [Choloepus didactylus]|uniref:extracellular tyrosine-protein kinase PKDCC-like n=1 Tax=Choloepus didactylus TaxID=27675 RepID=UPI00189C70D9|nr:extracellular tyrosine-protein kinase PKDCC-like [Choloepus didactylus]
MRRDPSGKAASCPAFPGLSPGRWRGSGRARRRVRQRLKRPGGGPGPAPGLCAGLRLPGGKRRRGPGILGPPRSPSPLWPGWKSRAAEPPGPRQQTASALLGSGCACKMNETFATLSTRGKETLRPGSSIPLSPASWDQRAEATPLGRILDGWGSRNVALHHFISPVLCGL